MHRFEILVSRPWEEIFFDDLNNGRSIYNDYNMQMFDTIWSTGSPKTLGVKYSVEVENTMEELAFKLKYGL